MFPKILEGKIFEKNWVKFSWKIKCFLYKMPTFPSKNWRFFQLFHWEHIKSQVLWFLKNPTLKNLVPQSVWKSLLVGLIPPFGSTADWLLTELLILFWWQKLSLLFNEKRGDVNFCTVGGAQRAHFFSRLNKYVKNSKRIWWTKVAEMG